MTISDNIRIHKPDTDQYGATEIRCIQNHFYVYDISSKWDTKKKRLQKVTGNVSEKTQKKMGLFQMPTV